MRLNQRHSFSIKVLDGLMNQAIFRLSMSKLKPFTPVAKISGYYKQCLWIIEIL